MNILYFNPDEMRADALGCYGHPRARTPNIDRLAAMGARFDQCHVQHTVCTPSRCSFMTGWYPHVAGHRTLWHLLRPHEPNTLKYLKGAGYEVRMIGKNDLLAAESFADSVTSLHPGRATARSRRAAPGDPHYYSFLYGPVTEGTPGDRDIVDRAVAFLDARPAEAPPFFLYLPTLYPHCPYTCPEPYYSMYDPDALPPMTELAEAGRPEYAALIRRYRGLDKLSDRDFRRIMAVYLGMVSYVDHLLGDLLAALERNGLMDDTAIFFFSDHGDWPGTGGLVEKWPSALDDGLTRIPMIVRIPGGRPGHVVSEPVECFDIMPTTLELAGVEARHTHFARSMIPQLKGAPGDPGRAVFAEGGCGPNEPHCLEGRSMDGIARTAEHPYHPKGRQQQEHPESIARAVMLRTATHKLVRRPGGVNELYDLGADPREQHNLYEAPEGSAIRATLSERMLEWLIRTSDVTPFTEDPRGYADSVRTTITTTTKEHPHVRLRHSAFPGP